MVVFCPKPRKVATLDLLTSGSQNQYPDFVKSPCLTSTTVLMFSKTCICCHSCAQIWGNSSIEIVEHPNYCGAEANIFGKASTPASRP